MFQVGESVVYGTTGVCTILSIGPLSMPGVDRRRSYYTLRPMYQEGAVYVPVGEDAPRRMRAPITGADARAFLDRIPEIPPCDVVGLPFKQRTDAYLAALHENRCEALVGVIKAVNAKRRGSGDRQAYRGDCNIRKRAMSLLCGELAYALTRTPEEVCALVEDALER